MEAPKKSKIAEMRANGRKRQKRIAFVSQLPIVFCILTFGTSQARNSIGLEVAGVLCAVFVLLGLAFYFLARAMKNAPDPYGFTGEGFTGEGVCPDCGEHGTLSYHVNEKKHRQKKAVGWAVAVYIPAFVLAYAVALVFINPKAGYDFLFLPLVLLPMLPLIVGLDALNHARFEVCRACGRNEPAPFNVADYGEFSIMFLCAVTWWRVWLHKKIFIVLSVVLPIVAFFAIGCLVAGGIIKKEDEDMFFNLLLIFWGVAMFFAVWFFPVAFSASRYFENFFGVKEIMGKIAAQAQKEARAAQFADLRRRLSEHNVM